MPKLDVNVGDEFPTEEIIRDEHGVVHHHHYYRRRRPYRPYGFLRVMLSLALVVMVLRLFQHAEWMDWDMNLPFMPHGYAPFAASLLGIAVVGVLLYALRCRDTGDRPW